MNNAKSTAKNALEYTGIVTLSQYTKGKRLILAKLRNAGGKPLFNFLSDCLIGDFEVARLNMPSKIALLKAERDESGSENLSMAQNTGFIYMLSKPEKVHNDVNGVVRYSFVIPQEFFSGIDFNAIGLYTSSATGVDLNDYAAIIGVDLENISLSISSVLVLDWELHISNKN